MQTMQEKRWPTPEELADTLREMGWRSVGDAQHTQLAAFWSEFMKKASTLEMNEDMCAANEKLLAAHDPLNPQPRHCHKCGLPMVCNPHPEAGEPAKYLEVGCPTECLPCLVANRHHWYGRAMAAESKLRMLNIDPRTSREEFEEALHPEPSAPQEIIPGKTA